MPVSFNSNLREEPKALIYIGVKECVPSVIEYLFKSFNVPYSETDLKLFEPLTRRRILKHQESPEINYRSRILNLTSLDGHALQIIVLSGCGQNYNSEQIFYNFCNETGRKPDGAKCLLVPNSAVDVFEIVEKQLASKDQKTVAFFCKDDAGCSNIINQLGELYFLLPSEPTDHKINTVRKLLFINSYPITIDQTTLMCYWTDGRFYDTDEDAAVNFMRQKYPRSWDFKIDHLEHLTKKLQEEEDLIRFTNTIHSSDISEIEQQSPVEYDSEEIDPASDDSDEIQPSDDSEDDLQHIEDPDESDDDADVQ